MNRLKLSRNNLSYLLHPSILSKNKPVFLPPLLRSLWRILSLPRRSSGAQNGTAKIHLLHYTATLPTNFFEKIFFLLIFSEIKFYFGVFLRKKSPFRGHFRTVFGPDGRPFSEFSGGKGRKTFNNGVWRTGEAADERRKA